MSYKKLFLSRTNPAKAGWYGMFAPKGYKKWYHGFSCGAPFLAIICLGLLTGCSQVKKATVTVDGQKLEVEIAETEALRTKGLSGREALADNAGMLFVWPQADYYSIWMQGMKFPLDIIWFNGDQVVDLFTQAPVPTNSDLKLIPIYRPKEKADKVLEVKAGFAAKHQIKIGSKLE